MRYSRGQTTEYSGAFCYLCDRVRWPRSSPELIGHVGVSAVHGAEMGRVMW